MRILYVSGTYHPSQAGAEISAQTFLRYLLNAGDNCLVLTGQFETAQSFTSENSYHRGIPLIRENHEKRELRINQVIDDFKPDVILTQQLWSDVTLRIAKIRGIPSVLRACRIPYELDISFDSEYSPSAIFSVSESAQQDIKCRWGRESMVIHPPIDELEVFVPKMNPWNNPYITLFNPIKEKGVELFAQLAKDMPDRQFAVILGWACLRNQTGEFDNSLIEVLCESLGIHFDGEIPKDNDLSSIPNITYLEPQDDVKLLYKQIHILCVPSIVSESFGRVVVEAAFNGIPVVASSLAGLKDTRACGGILVNEYRKVNNWVEVIRSLEDQSFYQTVSEREWLTARQKWNSNDAGDRLRKLLKSVTL